MSEVRAVDRQFGEMLGRFCKTKTKEASLLAAQVSFAASSGHGCWPVEEKKLPKSLPIIEKVTGDALNTHELKTNAPLVLCNGFLYLRKMFLAEKACERSLLALAGEESGTVKRKAGKKSGKKITIKHVSEEQGQAIEMALLSNLAVITGGPGTGKTTIVKQLLIELRKGKQQTEIALVAPTGKAAARLRESLQEDTQTLQKLLKIRPDTGRSGFNKEQPLKHDIVIVDEASMIDLMLMQQLLGALKPGAKLILLGDPYQLASVETGSVLSRMVLAAEKKGPLSECVATLTYSHRFENAPFIGELAQSVKAGDIKQVRESFKHGKQALSIFKEDEVIDVASEGYVPYKNALNAFGKIKDLSDGDIKKVFDAFNEWRVFSPYRDGFFGVSGLNNAIEKSLGLKEGKRYYFGRPVMIRENHPALSLNNGDIGHVLCKDGASVTFVSNTDAGGFRDIAVAQLPEHETAFALTVHKSQGSEFDGCYFVVAKGDKTEAQTMLLTRELLYTAITRARKQFCLSCSDKDLNYMVDSPTQRYSGMFTGE